jgi:magnesium chelatase family protein
MCKCENSRGHSPLQGIGTAEVTVDFRELTAKKHAGESSATIRARVTEARNIQSLRFAASNGVTTNAAMRPKQVREHCALDAESTGYLEQAMEQMHLSARAHDRILKVARTLADLAGSEHIRPDDVLEAIQYRSLDRKLFS